MSTNYFKPGGGRLIFVGASAAALLFASYAAYAQGQQAIVVSVCGNPPGGSYPPGQQRALTQDMTGTLCSSVSSGGSGGSSVTVSGSLPAGTNSIGTTTPTAASSPFSGAVIGLSPSLVIASGTAKTFVDIVNDSSMSSNVYVACANTSGAAVVYGSGAITLPPLWHRSFEGSFIETANWYCVASASGTNITYGVN